MATEDIGSKIMANAAEWEKTKSISLANSTMELLVELFSELNEVADDGKD